MNSKSPKEKAVYVLLHETISHSNLIKCLFQIELVEFCMSELCSAHSEFDMLKRAISPNLGKC